ncbi:MAG: hypothetical protein ACK55I_48615, partial [bacterium]
AATVCAWAGSVAHQAISRPQIGIADAAALGRDEEVDRVGRAQVRPVVRVDAADDGDLHVS